MFPPPPPPPPLPRKIWNLEARKCDFQSSGHQKACCLWVFYEFFVALTNFSGRRCCCIFFFLFIKNSFIFINEIQTDGSLRSLAVAAFSARSVCLNRQATQAKQTGVRGPADGGRLPVTSFYWNPWVISSLHGWNMYNTTIISTVKLWKKDKNWHF